jgi:hypothetical protein
MLSHRKAHSRKTARPQATPTEGAGAAQRADQRRERKKGGTDRAAF